RHLNLHARMSAVSSAQPLLGPGPGDCCQPPAPCSPDSLQTVQVVLLVPATAAELVPQTGQSHQKLGTFEDLPQAAHMTDFDRALPREGVERFGGDAPLGQASRESGQLRYTGIPHAAEFVSLVAQCRLEALRRPVDARVVGLEIPRHIAGSGVDAHYC